MKAVIFRSLALVLKPLEILFSIIVGVVAVYGVALWFDVPQMILNSWISSKLPSGLTVHLGSISGVFPLSFRMASLRIAKERKQIVCNNIEVTYLWPQNAFSAHVAEVQYKVDSPDKQLETETLPVRDTIAKTQVLEQRPESPPPSKTLLPITAIFDGQISHPGLNDSIERVYKLIPQICIILQKQRFLHSLKIESLYNNNHSIEANLEYSSTQNHLLHVRCQVPQGFYSVHLQGLRQDNASPQFDYETNIANRHNKFKVCGQVVLDVSEWRISSRVVKSSLQNLEEGRVVVKIYPQLVLDSLQGQTAPPAPFCVEKPIVRLDAAFPRSQDLPLFQVALTAQKTLHVTCLRNSLANLLNLNSYQVFPCAQNEKDVVARATVRLGSTTTIDVEAALSEGERLHCVGTYHDRTVILSNVEGQWRGRRFACSPLTYDVKKEVLHPFKLNVGSYALATTAFSREGEGGAPNKITLNPISLENQQIDFGTLSCEGKLLRSTQEHSWEAQLAFHLHPSVLAKGRKKPLCCEAKGALLVSPQRLVLEKTIVGTGQKSPGESRLAVDLEISNCREVPTWRELGRALRLCAQGSQSLQEASLRQDFKLRGSVNGKIDLRPITIFLNTGDRISGIVTSRLSLTGDLQNPLFQGTFCLTDGYYENVGNGVVLKDVTLQAVGASGGLDIQAIRLNDGASQKHKFSTFSIQQPPVGCAGGRGYVSFFSSAPHRAWDPRMGIFLNCQSMQVAYAELVKARATGRLQLEGPLTGLSTSPVVTGDVHIDAMEISVSTSEVAPEQEESWKIIEKNSKNSKRAVSSETPLQQPPRSSLTSDPHHFGMNILLRADSSSRVVVIDSGLECHLSGDMVAKGPMTDAYLIGSMQVDKHKNSHYNLFGKVMRVSKGEIIYDEKQINDPFLDLTLVLVLNGVEIFARLSGRLSALEMNLWSNPSLSTDEILSFVLFQQSLMDLSEQQNRQVKAVSSQIMAGSFGFLDFMRSRLKLDSIDLIEAQDPGTGETSQSLRLGKSLKNVRVFYDKDLATKNDSKVTVQYNVTPEISFNSSISTAKENSGFGVQWMKRY